MTGKLRRLESALRAAVAEEQSALQAWQRAKQRREEVKRQLVEELAAIAGYPFGCVAQGPRGRRILVDDAEAAADGTLLSLRGCVVKPDGSVGRGRRTIWLSQGVRRVAEAEIAG